MPLAPPFVLLVSPSPGRTLYAWIAAPEGGMPRCASNNMPSGCPVRRATSALACLLAALPSLAGCGEDSATPTESSADGTAESRPAPPKSAFPSAEGRTLAEVVESGRRAAPNWSSRRPRWSSTRARTATHSASSSRTAARSPTPKSPSTSPRCPRVEPGKAEAEPAPARAPIARARTEALEAARRRPLPGGDRKHRAPSPPSAPRPRRATPTPPRSST